VSDNYNLEWLLEEAWVRTIQGFQHTGALPNGLGVRHWQDATSLPPGLYVMAHCNIKGLQVSNFPPPSCVNPAAVEVGVFSATVADSDGHIADRVRGIITYQMVIDPGFLVYFRQRLPSWVSVGAVKRGDSHDYSENPKWKIRYVTFHVFGEFHNDEVV